MKAGQEVTIQTWSQNSGYIKSNQPATLVVTAPDIPPQEFTPTVELQAKSPDCVLLTWTDDIGLPGLSVIQYKVR